MTIQEAIEHTKNKKGMKQCLPGLLIKVASKRNKFDDGQRYALECIAKHFTQARQAWLEGDLETVAEFFGLYVD